jgi:PKD repeat protein
MLLSLNIYGQNCSILSKANNITPDKLCSPVTATWNASYTGVNDAGTPVSIRFNWKNGNIVTVPATKVAPGVFEATDVNIYTSMGNVCNYHPVATLIVNGVVCTSSSQEQIVTVWDDDDHNGGRMRINPKIYPICFGNSANARFQDLTKFNCVPPQEKDNPNVNTRWIQWIYGTDNTMITGIPVKIDGKSRTFPFTDDIITLTGPVTGSGVWSDVINVASDKSVGQYFEVTLRNWNYCNPYDDPNIPGKPSDHVNGDHPPVETTAIILIVPYPDATIIPMGTFCSNADPVTLTSVNSGGVWSGPGVVGNTFDPALAGPGDHIISYEITSTDGCSDSDETVITVFPIPDATIVSEGIVCATDPVFTLIANDPGGIWSGPGVVGSTFSPILAGPGNHIIRYSITNEYACTDSDETMITVATPDATITPVDTLCADSPAITLMAHDLGGIWSGPGVIGNTFNPILAGVGDHLIIYRITNTNCKDSDSTVITVMPVPSIIIENVGTVFVDGPSVTLEATPSGGKWSGTGVTDNIFNPDEAGIGTHIIQYETIPDRWGCLAKDTIHISVILPPAPIADFKPDTSGCSPLTVQFINTSLYSEVFTWNFGDGTFSNEENPVHTYYVPGTYSVELTANNITGESVYTGIVKVYQSPAAIFTAYPTNVENIEQTVNFYNYSHYDSLNLWRFGDGQISTEENPYHKYGNPGSYTVSLIIISKDGCKDSTETLITVAAPDASINPVDTLCADSQAITLTAHDSGGVWSGPGVIGNSFNPVIAGVGDHLITYSISYSNYTDADSIIITVMPVPEIIIDRIGTLYINDSPVILNANPAGGIWSGTGVTDDIFNPAKAGTGTHVIQYETIPDRWGCMSKDTIHISVILPPAPIADFKPDTSGCSPLTVQFINTSLYGEIFTWNFGDGTFSNEENPVHTYFLPGNYIVKLVVNNIAGQSIHNGKITVQQNPTAIFNAYPTNIVNNQQIVVFYNYSYYDSLYLWRFGDGQNSTEENPYHKYENPGSYTVNLTIISKDGCIDSAMLETPIIVEWKTGYVRFPNVFKWNETGPTGGQWSEGVYPEMDYVFRPFFENVLEYKLQIFNRWGVLIYESNDLYKGWDGYYKDGNLALQGVYVWKVTGRYADGNYFDMVGDVTFLH